MREMETDRLQQSARKQIVASMGDLLAAPQKARFLCEILPHPPLKCYTYQHWLVRGADGDLGGLSTGNDALTLVGASLLDLLEVLLQNT